MLVLTGLLTGEHIELADSILTDMKDFLQRLAKEEVNLKGIGLRGSLDDLITRIEQSFGLAREVAES
ncbi:hypothetical protein D3C80_1968230 [compost metagenome]